MPRHAQIHPEKGTAIIPEPTSSRPPSTTSTVSRISSTGISAKAFFQNAPKLNSDRRLQRILEKNLVSNSAFSANSAGAESSSHKEKGESCLHRIWTAKQPTPNTGCSGPAAGNNHPINQADTRLAPCPAADSPLVNSGTTQNGAFQTAVPAHFWLRHRSILIVTTTTMTTKMNSPIRALLELKGGL